jgi:hypothetical protein
VAMTNWRARVGARVGAWVGGFGVPGGFDATSGQRRLKGLVTSHAHVKALIAASGPGMNARARWLVRNNGYAANAIESWVANTVGDGISPNSSIAQAARKDAVQRLWLAWTDDADAEGLTDFYGLQRRAARCSRPAKCFCGSGPGASRIGLPCPCRSSCCPRKLRSCRTTQQMPKPSHRLCVAQSPIGLKLDTPEHVMCLGLGRLIYDLAAIYVGIVIPMVKVAKDSGMPRLASCQFKPRV